MPGPPAPRPRDAARLGWVALLVAGAVLGGCGAGAAQPGGGPPASAPLGSPGGASAGDTASAVDALLARREAALLAGDTEAYRGTVADPSAAGGRRQLEALDAARSLRVTRLSHDVVPPVEDPAAVDVTLRYRLEGLDRADRTAVVRYAVAEAGGRWVVLEESPASGAAAPPWLAMPGLAVRRTAHAVVAGTGGAAALDAAARTVDRALPALHTAWPGAPERSLVLVPDTSAEADALLGRAGGTVGLVGATTDGPVGADGLATGDEVVLDPQARRRLTAAGRDVVLTHELAHVAVRATVPGVAPTWLSEGYADHVGYTRADVPDAALLAPLVGALREGTAPHDLPDAASLDPALGDIEVGYLAAWQAVELVAAEHGEDGLRRLLRRCTVVGAEEAAERACDAAMPDVLGTDRAGLTRAWRQRLDDLAR